MPRQIDATALQDLIDRIDNKKAAIAQATAAANTAGQLVDKLVGDLNKLREQFSALVAGYL